MRISTSFLIATLLVVPVALQASQCNVKSGSTRVALLELYTSEGCSSCPPADEWLSKLSKQGVGPDQLLPLSLHVDYWDYIGWQDPFAGPEYTQRQREIGQRNRLRSIYTPQMVFNGRDFRSWRRQNISPLLKEVNAWPAAANLSLGWNDASGESLNLDLNAELLADAGAGSVLFLAVYENDLVSNVNAGENSGRALHHDYVVREMLAIPFLDKRQFSKQLKLAIKPEWKPRNLGIAVFVQNRTNGEVLQALSSPLKCKS